jgi:hypothetical protein
MMEQIEHPPPEMDSTRVIEDLLELEQGAEALQNQEEGQTVGVVGQEGQNARPGSR